MKRIWVSAISFFVVFFSLAAAQAQVACNSGGCLAYKMPIVNQNWSGFLPEWGFNNGRESTNLCAPSSVFMITRAITDSGTHIKKGTRVWTIGTTRDTFAIPFIAKNIVSTSVAQGTTHRNLINGIMSLRSDFATLARGESVWTNANTVVSPATVQGIMKRGGVPTITYGHFYQSCRLNPTGSRLYCVYQRRGGHTMAVRGWNSNGRKTYFSINDPAGARRYDVSFGGFLSRRSSDNMPIVHTLAGSHNANRVYHLKQGRGGYFGIVEGVTSLSTR